MNIITAKKSSCFFVAALMHLAIFCQHTGFLNGHKLETKDGLSDINVRKIIHDKFGFYWIATQGGLNRFDGVRFHKFTSGSLEAKKALTGTDVFDIEIDNSKNRLYAATAYGGLNIISIDKNMVLKKLPARDKKNASLLWLTCMGSSKTAIYTGSYENIIQRFNKQSDSFDLYCNVLEKLSLPASSRIERTTERIAIDGKNRVWVLIRNTGIIVLDSLLKTTIRFFPFSELNIEDGEHKMFTGIGAFGDFFILGTNNGIRVISTIDLQIKRTEVFFPGIPPLVLTNKIHCLSSDGTFVTVVSRKKIYRFAGNSWGTFVLNYNEDIDNWLLEANNILFTSRNIMIGTQYGVLWVKNLDSPFQPFSLSSANAEIKIPHATTLLRENDSIAEICATSDIFRANTRTGVITCYKQPGFYFNLFSPDPEQVMFSVKGKALMLVNKNGITEKAFTSYSELRGIDTVLLIGAAKYRDSVIFLAAEDPKKGIFVWNKLKKEIRIIDTSSQPVALKSPVINRLFVDSKNKIWIICDNTVSLYDHEKKEIQHLVLKNPVSKEHIRINMDICETPNHFWIASYGTGIVKVSKNNTVEKIYSETEGLNNSGLYKIFSFNDTMIAVSSNNGLSFLNINTGHITNYFASDGLMSNNFEETSGCQYKKELFFGGVNGFTKINTEKLNYQTGNLEIYFTDLEILQRNEITDSFDLFSTYYSIPKNYDRVTIHFTVTGATYPDKVIFQFRIREKGNNWTNLGTRRFVDLIGLSPNTYHLEIRAANENGVWSNPKTLTLHFLPKFHQTLGFKIGVGLLIFGLIYSFYRFRISQIKKQQKIRKDISTDLHDDIGSTLNSVKVYTHLALEGKEKEHYIQMARQNLEQASIGLRDMIWVLDDKLDTAEELLTRIKQFTIPLANALEIETDFKCDFDIQHKVFTKEEKRNLLLICKEAINNCFKYSEASLLSVHFTPEKKSVRVTIADNGKGFDMNNYIAGNGLKNMQHRAKHIGYHINISSIPQQGTTITLTHG